MRWDGHRVGPHKQRLLGMFLSWSHRRWVCPTMAGKARAIPAELHSLHVHVHGPQEEAAPPRHDSGPGTRWQWGQPGGPGPAGGLRCPWQGGQPPAGLESRAAPKELPGAGEVSCLLPALKHRPRNRCRARASGRGSRPEPPCTISSPDAFFRILW